MQRLECNSEIGPSSWVTEAQVINTSLLKKDCFAYMHVLFNFA